jgi:DNA mismatch repair ATPase MutS/CheY-like chemotaxis protein
MLKTSLAILTLVSFLVTGIVGPMPAYAQDYHLPAPGVMVHLGPEFNPAILKGIKVHPDNPFRFDFILDKGDSQLSNDALKDESSKLIKYFLASLTIPEKDLWVNLSPYEKDTIIPQSFGLTEMGRDLLAEDYMLKQITASLIYPEDEVGKRFWKRIYEEAAKKFGTTNIPVNTFNKVWIVPEKAVVYENAKAGTAYVVESKLKVMLEQDYLSLEKHEGIQSAAAQVKDTNQLGSQIVREVVIPELTKEVNEDKNFSRLRQVYNSLILATWYKKKIKDSILGQVYADKNKVAGVSIDDPQEKERIYERYLRAFKKGVYNYIKEEIDPISQQTIPRKYFSGGESLYEIEPIFRAISDPSMLPKDNAALVDEEVNLNSAKAIEDRAMVDYSDRMRMRESDLHNIGLFLYDKHSGSTVRRIFPRFTKAPKEIVDMVSEKIKRPYRTREKIAKEQQVILYLINALGSAQSSETALRLEKIVKQIDIFSYERDWFYEELRILRYRTDETFRAKSRGRDGKGHLTFSHPMPNYPLETRSLIYLGRMIIAAGFVYNQIPDESQGWVQVWKKDLKSFLVRPEIKFFLEQKNFLSLISRNPNADYFANIEEPEADKDLELARAEFRKIHEKFADIGVLNLEQQDKRGGPAAQPFLRQFPDGLMKKTLGTIGYYSRLAMMILEDGYTFPNISAQDGKSHPIGTLELNEFRNPLLVNADETGFGPTETLRKQMDRIEPTSISLDGNQNALLLTGPNMGGKTTTARAVALSVLMTQIGFPLPVHKAEMGLFRNIYTVFPAPDQFKAGYGYFESLLQQLTNLLKIAQKGDLIILDEVPVGTDYFELVSVATVLIEDFIKTGATVVVTGHLKKAIELIARRTGQTPFMHTVEKKDGSFKPNFKFEPGVAKHSYAIELLGQAGFPKFIQELARVYYSRITNQQDAEKTLAPINVNSSVDHDIQQGESVQLSKEDWGEFQDLLVRLFPRKNFVFDDYSGGGSQETLIKMFQSIITGNKEAAGVAVAYLTGEEAKDRHEKAQERLRITDLLVSQKRSFLETLQSQMRRFKEYDEPGFGFRWGSGNFKLQEKLDKIDGLKVKLGKFIQLLEALKTDPEFKEYFDTLSSISDGLNKLREEYAGKKIDADLDRDAFRKLEEEWDRKWKPLVQGIIGIMKELDIYIGVARSNQQFGLKPAQFSENPNTFKLENSKPFSFDNYREELPFVERAVAQSFDIDSTKPVMILTGPNSSGKSVLMLNSWINSVFAMNGFYVSGDFKLSRFDNVYAFFGGKDNVQQGESYFLNIIQHYAEIIRNATPNSLIILDELHGTDNFELAAIQLAVLHYLRSIKATVIFNTHIRDGIKALADQVGLDLWKTDVDFRERTKEVIPRYTVSRDPNSEAKSYGLAVAQKWLTQEQSRRAQSIYDDLTRDGAMKAGDRAMNASEGGEVKNAAMTIADRARKSNPVRSVINRVKDRFSRRYGRGMNYQFATFHYDRFGEGSEGVRYNQPMEKISILRMGNIANMVKSFDKEKATFVEFGAGSAFGSYLLAKEGHTAVAVEGNREYVKKQAQLNGLIKLPGARDIYVSRDPKLRFIYMAGGVFKISNRLQDLKEALKAASQEGDFQMWEGFDPFDIDMVWDSYQAQGANWLSMEESLGPKAILHIWNTITGTEDSYRDTDRYVSVLYWEAPSEVAGYASYFHLKVRQGMDHHDFINELKKRDPSEVEEYGFIRHYKKSSELALVMMGGGFLDIDWSEIDRTIYAGSPLTDLAMNSSKAKSREIGKTGESAAQLAQEDRAMVEEKAEVSIEKPRILILDDNPRTLDQIIKALGSDFEITTAVTMEQAVHIIENSNRFYLVISDLNLSKKFVPGIYQRINFQGKKVWMRKAGLSFVRWLRFHDKAPEHIILHSTTFNSIGFVRWFARVEKMRREMQRIGVLVHSKSQTLAGHLPIYRQDGAMNAGQGLTIARRGGIDLTPAHMNLQIRNTGEAIKFHIDPAQLAQLQNAPGFVPVIINIQPMRDLRAFLGVPSDVSTASVI